MTYNELNEKLTGRNAERRKLANNTYAERREGGAIAVRLHGTDVLTYHNDGSVTVTSGGWKTVTTKARINEHAPYGVGITQRRGVWYWERYNGNGGGFTRLGLFTDGDTIKADGTVRLQNKGDDKASLKIRRRVATYAALCAAALPLALPGAGDCWHCAMTTQEGQALGDACKDASHIESHIEEGYVVPSLVYQALKERGYGDLILSMTFDESGKVHKLAQDYVKRAVRKYVLRRLGAVV